VGALAGALSYGIRGGWADVPLYTALALLMVPLAVPGRAREIFPLNPPQWSLLFEVLANLMHGLLLRRLRDGALLALALAFALPLVWFSMGHGNNSLGPDTRDWYLGLPRVGFAYSLGVWMGRRHARGPRRALVNLPVALMLPLLAMVVASVLRTNSWIVDSVVVLLAFPAAIWLASATPPGRAARGLELLGSLSFPIYAVHLPIVTAFAFHSTSLPSAVAAVLASLLASWLLATGLERRLARRPKAGAAPAAGRG
jgi:peptidoglycan/LPS O-acetylase OafA/YrhL